MRAEPRQIIGFAGYNPPLRATDRGGASSRRARNPHRAAPIYPIQAQQGGHIVQITVDAARTRGLLQLDSPRSATVKAFRARCNLPIRGTAQSGAHIESRKAPAISLHPRRHPGHAHAIAVGRHRSAPIRGNVAMIAVSFGRQHVAPHRADRHLPQLQSPAPRRCDSCAGSGAPVVGCQHQIGHVRGNRPRGQFAAPLARPRRRQARRQRTQPRPDPCDAPRWERHARRVKTLCRSRSSPTNPAAPASALASERLGALALLVGAAYRRPLQKPIIQNAKIAPVGTWTMKGPDDMSFV